MFQTVKKQAGSFGTLWEKTRALFEYAELASWEYLYRFMIIWQSSEAEEQNTVFFRKKDLEIDIYTFFPAGAADISSSFCKKKHLEIIDEILSNGFVYTLCHCTNEFSSCIFLNYMLSSF